MDEIVHEFLVESHENLDRLDRDLVELEKAPADREILSSIFRTIHTIKGTCGFLGYSKLEAVTHVGESLLSKLRDGELTLSPALTTGMLRMIDAVRQILASIERKAEEGDGEYSELIALLTQLAQPRVTEAMPEPVVASPILERAGPKHGAETEQVEAPIGLVSLSEAAQSAEGPVSIGEPLAEQRPAGLAETNIRVDVKLLDKLMDLVGELVLARNQILQNTAIQQDPSLVRASQRLNLLTLELQQGVMKARMQPIGNVWNKFPRVLRDLALACGKQIRVDLEGKEIELDRTIIEAIKDPLTHIVRNSADHGIEAPAVRRECGKSAEGRIFLRAFHEGGQVNIEISDDGRGVDLAKVKAKALLRRIISREEAARMSEREALNLIFQPGFSTSDKVTHVSGRGVGMDVVKTNIEKIGGTVDIQSQPGQGTTIKIKIPLTLAIIPALIVTSGGERFAIPQVSLLELVRLQWDEVRSRIEMISSTPVYRLRGNLLPLVHLNEELKLGDRESAGDEINIVVLQANDRPFGLIVDAIHDTEEIVVKPLAKQLKGVAQFAGATIMGDGRLALILDVMGIAQHSNVISNVRDRRLLPDKTEEQGTATGKQEAFLLCRVRDNGQVAIPLSSVARLEEFEAASIELAGEQEVAQYRDQILPIVRLGDLLHSYRAKLDSAKLSVVVVSCHGLSAGLVVDEIVDIVEEELSMQGKPGRAGITGSAIIQQRVTDVLSIEQLMRMAHLARVGAEAAA